MYQFSSTCWNLGCFHKYDRHCQCTEALQRISARLFWFLTADHSNTVFPLYPAPVPSVLLFFLLLRKEMLSHASKFFLSDAFTIRTSSLILTKEGSEHPGLEPGTYHAAVACSPYCDIVAWDSVFLFKIWSEWNIVLFLTCI